jgi:hypothetical protein
MENTTFDGLFDSIIEAIKENKADKKYASLICETLQQLKGAFREYIDTRDGVKNGYMEDEKKILDRHKCAASLMLVCMEKTEKLDISGIGENMKEKLAILIGLTVLRTFVELDDREKHDDNSKLIAFLAKNGGRFKFPNTICDDKPYEVNWAHELHHGWKEKKLFVLSLAHELFWIETYNKLLA